MLSRAADWLLERKGGTCVLTPRQYKKEVITLLTKVIASSKTPPRQKQKNEYTFEPEGYALDIQEKKKKEQMLRILRAS